MKKYEIMTIVHNSFKTADAKKYVEEAINGRIKNFGGKVTFEDFWGEKGFAYIIEGEKWGYYNVTQFEMDPAKTIELRSELNIDNKIVRFLITNVEENDPEPKTKETMDKENEAREKEKEIEAAADAAKAVKVKTAAKAESKKEASAPKAEPKKDDVDKKLDQIIEDSTADL